MKKPKAIIFGIAGQDGFYLDALLKTKDIETIGASRSDGPWKKINVANGEAVVSFIKETIPDYVFHLAANSTAKHEVLFENHETISTGTWNILEAVRQYAPNAKVFLSGSALQFQNKGEPISETDPFEANDPYSVSRIQSVYAARYYRTLGIKAYVGYFFNHDSPLRTERHINKKIVSAVQRLKKGSSEKIEIGSLKAKKEFSFAGDLMEAVWTLVNQEKVFEAVLGSGKAYSIQNWIEICFGLVGMDWQPHVVQQKTFVPSYSTLVSNPQLIKSLGWQPKVGIEELAKLMLTHN